MPIRATRSALLGGVLALVAMFGVVALSSWHNAIVHHDDPVHVLSIEHDHGSSNPADPDGPVHVLAHVTGQWVATADAMTAPILFAVAAQIWPLRDYRLRSGIKPSELLRPPRG